MTSPVKLPPLPDMDIGVNGQVKFAYSAETLKAYAEQAVLEALRAHKFRSVADERKAFEEWAKRKWGERAGSMLMRDRDGDYVYLSAEWSTWISRAAKGPPG